MAVSPETRESSGTGMTLGFLHEERLLGDVAGQSSTSARLQYVYVATRFVLKLHEKCYRSYELAKLVPSTRSMRNDFNNRQ